MSTTVIILISTIAVLLVWGIAIYNQLVALANRYKNAFAQIEVQLKRRYDLIPNLVESAKGYLSHERDTLEAVVAARNDAASALKAISDGGIDSGSIKQLSGAEGALGAAMGKLNVVMEAYPDLKANQNFSDPQAQLEGTENRITVARKDFNGAVKTHNGNVRRFPGAMWAGLFGFDVRDYFEAVTGSEAAPSVDFGA